MLSIDNRIGNATTAETPVPLAAIKTTFMYKVTILLCLTVLGGVAHSKNIYSALQLNENTDYKTSRPKNFVETITYYNSNGKQVDTYVKAFDKAGMLITEEQYESGNLKARLTYTNDTTKRLKQSRV
ncbi:MAG TPA: hypothetical protein VEZ55_10695 [Chitinophagaceae bacterium]|nr:hypothetical protein [Chitinophagaceae bacterium]